MHYCKDENIVLLNAVDNAEGKAIHKRIHKTTLERPSPIIGQPSV